VNLPTEAMDAHFKRADEAVSRILKSWKENNFTRDQMLTAWLASGEIHGGRIMQACCAVVMARRLIECEAEVKT
jgi:hypothetical protein